MMLAYAVLLVIGSVLTAAAQNAGMFIVGHVIQGLCTSLLLIAAVPPWPSAIRGTSSATPP